ncbi:C1 family peptidase, partial [Persicitalea sp.]|uniref:C1 family peptidase n=1 Tax=Persicitalea sp. TaxID=3100273 RepID=UPI00359383BC
VHFPVYAQGLKFDDTTYEKLPQKYSARTTGSGELPVRIDLSPYTPSVMSQGKLGTCMGFSSAYYARTILEAVSRGITDRAQIDALRFSPSFLYNAIKDSTDFGCVKGSLIDSALAFMRDNGVATFADQDYPYCGKNNLSLVKSESRIMDYIRLFGLLETENAVLATKKALSEMTPVIIGIQTTPSPQELGFWGKIWRWIVRFLGGGDDTGLWKPTKSNKRGTGHAVCVVGYDDTQFEGAFKIVNSWGKSWGEDGYFWVTYPDFAEFTKYGYQAYLPIAPDSAGVTMAGTVSVQSATFVTDNEVPYVRSVEGKTNQGSENQEGMVAYTLRDAQRTGSSFKFVAEVDRLAYVYVVAADASELRTEILFPVSDKISPIIGANTQMLLPSQDLLYTLVGEPGIQYWLFLFSEKELDIEKYVFDMNEAQGDFTNRVLTAFGEELVPYEKVEYDDRKVNFTLRGQHEGHIVPLLISLKHE